MIYQINNKQTDYADAINTLNKEVMDIQKFDNQTAKWIDQQNVWDQRVDDFDQLLAQRNAIVAQQLAGLQKEVGTNFLMIVTLQGVVDHLNKAVDKGFADTRLALIGLLGDIGTLANKTGDAVDNLQGQIKQILTLLDATDNGLKGTIITQYQ